MNDVASASSRLLTCRLFETFKNNFRIQGIWWFALSRSQHFHNRSRIAHVHVSCYYYYLFSLIRCDYFPLVLFHSVVPHGTDCVDFQLP